MAGTHMITCLMATNHTPVLFPQAWEVRCGGPARTGSRAWFDIREAERASFACQDTSFGEASSRTQATDPNRRETLRIRTPLPGLRGEAKWLRSIATPWSAKALTREVTFPSAWAAENLPALGNGWRLRLVSRVKACTSAADEGRRAMDSDSPGRSRPHPAAVPVRPRHVLTRPANLISPARRPALRLPRSAGEISPYFIWGGRPVRCARRFAA